MEMHKHFRYFGKSRESFYNSIKRGELINKKHEKNRIKFYLEASN